MKRFLLLTLILSACTVAEPNRPESRQNDLVIYDAGTAIRFVENEEVNSIYANCRELLHNTIEAWGEERSFFGIVYGAYVDRQCIFTSDADAASPEEAAKFVRQNCEVAVKRLTGKTRRCVPIYHVVPRGVTLSEKRAVGHKTGQDLQREIAKVGNRFGAMALSADGAWSIEIGDTRAEADAKALTGCREITGGGYDALGPKALEEMRDSCTVVYRFGRDFPEASEIEVIRGG